MEEIWKDVVGYEGYYKVSNLGRVKSLDRIGIDGRQLRGKILPQRNRSGYWAVSLRKNGSNSDFSVHRLVAEAFIPNLDPIHKTQVGHKDEKNLKNSNECNNNVENLEWVTPEENSNMPQRSKRISKGRKGMAFSETHRKHIGDAQRGKKGHPISEETKEKLRQARLNYKVSEETKKKLSESHKGQVPSNRKKVICNNIIYDSLTDFCKQNNIDIRNLSAWLREIKEMPIQWREQNLRYYCEEKQ